MYIFVCARVSVCVCFGMYMWRAYARTSVCYNANILQYKSQMLRYSFSHYRTEALLLSLFFLLLLLLLLLFC